MENYQLIKTNMCMVYNDAGEMLVVNRTKSDWPGLTFPGGHVEPYETLYESVIREVKEETGLTIRRPHYIGKIVWINDNKKICEVAYLFKTSEYEGTVTSSNEGDVFFVKIKDYKKHELSTDFEKVVDILLKQ